MASAEHQFRLGKADSKGVTFAAKMAHLGRVPVGPEVPPQAAHLLDWFGELSTGRTSNGFGPNPLTWSDITAWASLTGTDLRPWEVRLLKQLDIVFLNVHAEGANEC